MHEQLIGDIALCIGAAWGLGVVAHWFRQPALLAYLVAGFIIGPAGFRLVSEEDSIRTIAELGLMFLLFMIGLEIDLKKIRGSGRVVLGTAGAQILGTFALGTGFFLVLGFPLGHGRWDALYLAVAAALSSTVIIVKILYDRRELDTLPGRITLGVLVLQDLFAILFLAVQPNLSAFKVSALLLSLASAVFLVAVALLVSRYVLPPIFSKLARLPELVLVGALAWCFAIGELGHTLRLSREMGALIAGVAISTYPYAVDVTARVTSLRDFFVTLFFVGLGMSIAIPTWPIVGAAGVFSLFLLGSRVATVFVPLHRLGQGLRASLLPSLHLAQVSEFSLVILSLGVQKAHIDAGVSGAVAFAFVVLATLSTWGITRSDTLVRGLVPRLKALGLRDLDSEAGPTAAAGDAQAEAPPRVVLLGFFRTASSLLEELSRRAPQMLERLAVVDFNPQALAGLRARGVRVIYGDITQSDTLLHAGVQHAEVLVCTIPDSLLKGTTNLRLVRRLRELNPGARLLTVAERLADVPLLRAAGADYVAVPRLAEAVDLCRVVLAAEQGSLDAARAELELALKDRREVLP